MGSGKTACGSVESIALSMRYPGNRGLIGRWSKPELEISTQKIFLEEVIDPGLMADCQFYKGRNLLVFPNGSEIIFTHLRMLNPERFRSMQLGFYWLDEAIEAGCEEAHDELKKRLRLPGVGRRCAFFTSNPGAEASYLFNNFTDKGWLKSRHYEEFKATSLENPYLPDVYLELMQDLDHEQYQMFVMGEWQRARGKIFEIFDRQVHVIQPFQIPEGWLRFRSMDFGIAHAMVCGWWALDEENGRLIQYREWASPDQSLPDFVDTVQSLEEGERIAYSVIDPAAKARSIQTGVSTYDQLAQMGMSPVLGDNDVLGSIRRINGLLRYSQTSDGFFLRKPAIFWFDHCLATIGQMERYQWDVVKGKTTGKPLKKHDDCVDMVRYAVMNSLQVQPSLRIDPAAVREPTNAELNIRKMCAINEARRLAKSGEGSLMSRAAPRFMRRARHYRVRGAV